MVFEIGPFKRDGKQAEVTRCEVLQRIGFRRVYFLEKHLELTGFTWLILRERKIRVFVIDNRKRNIWKDKRRSVSNYLFR